MLRNVTGVLEHEHVSKPSNFVEAPMRRIAVIVDRPTWRGVVERMRRDLSQIDDAERSGAGTGHQLDEFKRSYTRTQGKVDAMPRSVCGVKDGNGSGGGLRKTEMDDQAQHSPVSRTGSDAGTLCAVTSSGYETGPSGGK